MEGNRRITEIPADRRPEEFDALWAKVFGDDQDLIVGFFLNFSREIRAYGLWQDNQLISALTQFLMGRLVLPDMDAADSSRDVYVSYAICTDPDARGQGAGSEITRYAGEEILKRGSLSVLSPAEESLINFYQPMGYRSLFPAQYGSAVSGTIGDLLFDHIPAEEYNRLREEFLSKRPHIALSQKALRLVQFFSWEENGFYAVRRLGQEGVVIETSVIDAAKDTTIEAITVLGLDEEGNPLLQEILVSPSSSLTTADIAGAFAAVFGHRFESPKLNWRAPVPECSITSQGQIYTQAMILCSSDTAKKLENSPQPPYFGFPFD